MKILFTKIKTEELNIADWISFYRILISPVLLLLIFLNIKLIFAIFLAVSFFSDALDGFLARRLKIVTPRGAYLDSIGDVITYIAAVIGLFWFEFNFIKEQIVLLSIVIGLYLFQLGLAYIRYGKPSSFHTYSVKVAAVFQVAFLMRLFFFEFNLWFFYIAVFLSIIEAFEEITLIFVLPKWKTNVKGLYWVLRRKK